MARTDIGPKISVEGEQQYRQQMKNIIQQQKEYAAEMASTTAALGKNSTAQQKATSVASVLSKQIQAQEAAIKLQNVQLQSAVAKYGAASNEASAYRTSIYKTNADLQTMKSRLEDAKNGMGEFADKTDKAADSLGSIQKKSGFFDGMAGEVAKGQTLATAFSAIAGKIKEIGSQAVTTGVNYNAQVEQYQVALTNMLGSQEKASETLEQIKKDAARTPFDTANLVKANEYLISTGETAENSRKTILALGDAVSAVGGGSDELGRMAQNLQQIKNAGKATAADIKQFAYAGIDVYGILADYTGKSTAEVQKMTVTYDLLTAALQNAAEEGGRYYNSMNAQSETINGKLSTLKDNATQLSGALTANLTTAFGNLVTKANELAVAMKDGFDTGGFVGMMNAASETEPKLSAVASAAKFCAEHSEALKIALGTLAAAFITAKGSAMLLSTAQLAINAAMSANPIGIVIAALGGLAGALGTAYASNETFRNGVNNLASSFQNVAHHAQSAAKAILGYKAATTDAQGFGGSEGGSFTVDTSPKNTITDEERQRRKDLHDARVSQAKQEKLLADLAETSGSGSSKKSSSPKQTAADTKKLADSVTSTATELVTGTEGIVGAIKRVTETADNTYNVYDGTTKQLKGTTKETAQTITETWTQVVDGQEQNFKRVQTLLDGVITSTKTTSDAVAEATRTATNTRTETVKGTEDMVGNITRTTETTTQTAKAVDAVTGEIKDTVISATEVVTDCYTRIKDGQKQTVTETKTYVNGVLTDVKEKSEDLNADLQNTEGILGGFSGFILDLDTKLGGLEKAAQSLKKSPLGSWFYDMAKGYRAWDSFWDNVDVGSLITNGLVAFATGYTNTQNGGLANGLQTMMLSVMSNLVGVNLSSLQGLGSTWGSDLVKGMASGMVTVAAKSGLLMKAVKLVGGVIRAFLHFSRPDKGPLRDYETWMPDMVHGMADSLKNNAYVLRNAARDVSSDLQTQMQYDVGMASPSYEQNYKSSTVKLGGVTMTIQAQPGMDEEKLAQYTIDRLSQMINEEAASSGQIPVF